VELSESLQSQLLLWADSVSISSGSGLGLAAQALEVVSFRSVLGLDSRALEILGLAAGALEVVMLWLAKSGIFIGLMARMTCVVLQDLEFGKG
jgi:hypothetical protein